MTKKKEILTFDENADTEELAAEDRRTEQTAEDDVRSATEDDAKSHRNKMCDQ